MTFKAEWEKTDQHYPIAEETIQNLLKKAFPNSNVEFYQIISGGCANLNIKFKVDYADVLFILRIYLREKDAAYREQKLGAFLSDTIPIPQVYSIDDWEDYRFAIVEYLPGMTLRDLLLGQEKHDISSVMFAAGETLAQIQTFRFTHSGFFNNSLEVVKTISQMDYVEFSKDCIQQLTADHGLDNETLARISYFIERFHPYFPNVFENHLVHADFDPANILVAKRSNGWEISGILDWEFSFSGSPLCDVANMLRYSHHMPTTFERAFIQGVETGYTLPENWRLQVYLMNLLALLDCLALSPMDKRPKRCQDICSLIHYIILQLETFN